ncbi:hypothetical protein D3C75_1284010 [compost metagenome]
MQIAVKAKGRHSKQAPTHFDFDLETMKARVESAKTNVVRAPASAKSVDDILQWLNAQ